MDLFGIKRYPIKTSATPVNCVAKFDVYLRGAKIETVFETDALKTCEEVKQSLVEHDCFDPNIKVKKV